ncbi:helix-turn-helix transcriptional regulator [Lactobacillus acidophilus]
MTIGEALKNERIRRGLSIRKMAGNIIDPSSYSKVEKNMRNIGSEALVRLLFAHDIDINEFFTNLESNYACKNFINKIKLEKNMRIAFNNRDLAQMQAIHQKIMNLKGEEILKLRSIVAIAYLTNNVNNLDNQIKERIFKQLDKNDNLSNNIEAIRLFANAMPIFTDDQLNYLMQSYVSKIIKKENISELDNKRFAVASVNYLRACYERKFSLNETMLQIQDYILNINDTSFLEYKGLVKLSLAAIMGKIDRAKEIKRELINIGYEQVKEWKF